MQRDNKEQTTRLPALPAELVKKILAANFVAFPGDLKLFDENALSSEEFAALKNFEARLVEKSPFGKLEAALNTLRPAVTSMAVYRWLCLLYAQNILLTNEVEKINAWLGDARRDLFELRNDMSEGTMGFRFQVLAQGRSLFDPDVIREDERIRQGYRERKKREAELESKNRIEASARARKRSGAAPAYAHTIDWLQWHTEQEYVDAFAEKTIHVKRVREFLKPFARKAQRRGAGRNKPLEYPIAAGLALLEYAATNWITDPSKRLALVFATAAHQIALPSALTAKGFRLRSLLHRLWTSVELQEDKNPISSSLRDLTGTDDGWRLWYTAVREGSSQTHW